GRDPVEHRNSERRAQDGTQEVVLIRWLSRTNRCQQHQARNPIGVLLSNGLDDGATVRPSDQRGALDIQGLEQSREIARVRAIRITVRSRIGAARVSVASAVVDNDAVSQRRELCRNQGPVGGARWQAVDEYDRSAAADLGEVECEVITDRDVSAGRGALAWIDAPAEDARAEWRGENKSPRHHHTPPHNT